MPRDKKQTSGQGKKIDIHQKLQYMLVKDVKADPKKNPRKKEDKESFEELKSSIAAQGVIIPVMVYPNKGEYELICGFRRLKAARQLHMKKIPVIIRKDLDDQGIAEIQALENLQRADLDIIDEASGFRDMIKRFGWRIKDIADKVGKSEKYVSKRLVVLDAPEYVQQALSQNEITIAHAIILRCIQDLAEQKEMFKNATDHGWSARELLDRSQPRRINSKTPFDITACTKCRWYGPNQRQLLLDEIGTIANEKICHNKSCFDKKMQEAKKLIIEKFKKQGVKVEELRMYEYFGAKRRELSKAEQKNLKDSDTCVKCEDRVIELREAHEGGFETKNMCTKPKCANWKVDKSQAALRKKEREIIKREDERLDHLAATVEAKFTPGDVMRIFITQYLDHKDKRGPVVKAVMQRYGIDKEQLKGVDHWRWGEELCKRVLPGLSQRKLGEMMRLVGLLYLRHDNADLLAKMARPARKVTKKKG